MKNKVKTCLLVSKWPKITTMLINSSRTICCYIKKIRFAKKRRVWSANKIRTVERSTPIHIYIYALFIFFSGVNIYVEKRLNAKFFGKTTHVCLRRICGEVSFVQVLWYQVFGSFSSTSEIFCKRGILVSKIVEFSIRVQLFVIVCQ